MTPAVYGAVRYPSRILCPTDFTPFSRRALEYALPWRGPWEAKLLLHVLLLPLPSIDSDDEPLFWRRVPAEVGAGGKR
jgi:hypothetical protein